MRLDPNQSQSELKELLERNIALSEQTLRYTKKVHTHLFWSRIFGLLKLAIILAPFVAAAWFLPPYIKPLITTVQSLVGTGQQAAGDIQQFMERINALEEQTRTLQEKIPR